MFKQFSIITLAAIFMALPLFAQQAEVKTGDTIPEVAEDSLQKQTMGVHPWSDAENEANEVSTELANWSLFIEGGGNVFDGDFTSEKKHCVYLPTVGAGFEYSFNSTWGIGGEYKFRGYKVTGDNASNPKTAPTMLKGHMHQADAFITFDIFNLWRPQNKHKLFSLDLILGGGAAWYKNSEFYPNTYFYKNIVLPNGTPWWEQRLLYNTANETPGKDSKYHATAVFLGGVNFQFNVCRVMSLGVRAVYNMFTKDEVDGRVRGNNNDGIFDMDLSMRFKLQSRGKSHVRNFHSESILYELAGNDASEGDKPVSKKKKKTADNTTAQKDTVVVMHRDTIVVIKNEQGIDPAAIASLIPGSNTPAYDKSELQQNYFYVYFDPNEATLYDQGLTTIQQVAARMQREPDLYMLVDGYCDNTGTDEINDALGQKRADNVADEFVAEYGIDASRIRVTGRGVIHGRRSTAAYAPNRRADIHLVTKEEFEGKVDKTPVAESQKVPAGKKVVVEDKVTLSKLARKYYGNNNCWYFIYAANLDKIPDHPSNLEVGTELIIPELNNTQKLLSKDDAADLFKKLQKTLGRPLQAEMAEE